jgi:lysophospholipase L1-like esterase
MRAAKPGGLVLVACLIAVLCAPPSSFAGPASPTKVSVSLGDSFISGEAGRWNGNSLNPYGTRSGTDRAAYNCTWYGSCSYDATRVYGSSFNNDCDRSNVAPIMSAAVAVNERINIACSGARTQHIWRAAAGGQSFKGEAPQADQLAAIAAQKDVDLIVLTITANDLGFSDHVIDCTVAWTTSSADNPRYCNAQEQAEMNAAMPAARTGLAKAIDEIRAVMAAAGYTQTGYRFVVMGYASPIPVGADIRYPETGWSRLTEGGCPFWNADANWAKNTATPFIVDNMRQIAAQKGVKFLDVRNALNGREVCHRNVSLVGSGGPSETRSEWVRWLNSGCCQGESQESLHPNAYGQRAMGRCIALIYAVTTGNRSCSNTPGQGVSAMTLSAIP